MYNIKTLLFTRQRKIVLFIKLIFLLDILILYPLKAILQKEVLFISDIILLMLFSFIILNFCIHKKTSYNKHQNFYYMYPFLVGITMIIIFQGFFIKNSFVYLKGIRNNYLYIYFYFIPFLYKLTKKEINDIYIWISFLSFISSLYAIKQYIFGYESFEIQWQYSKGYVKSGTAFYRFFSTLGSPNIFACVILIGFAIYIVNFVLDGDKNIMRFLLISRSVIINYTVFSRT